MNYITRLQNELAEARAELAAKDAALQAFRAHIASEKFRGFAADGSRKDWIAVRDVDTHLCLIIAAGNWPF